MKPFINSRYFGLQFQYKALQPELRTMDVSDLRDILQQQIGILDVFNSNDILLQYMEKQPIEMLLEFTGVLLHQICEWHGSFI